MTSERIQLNLRLDKFPALYEELKIRAKEESSSLNDFVINLLRQGLGREASKSPLAEALERICALEQRLQDIDRIYALEQRLEDVERQLRVAHAFSILKPKGGSTSTLTTTPVQGLTQRTLCDLFAIDASDVARRARAARITIPEWVESQTGWYYNPDNHKYYSEPPDSHTAGLTKTALCKRFGFDARNLARKAATMGLTTEEWLEQRTGWKFNENDRRYYLIDSVELNKEPGLTQEELCHRFGLKPDQVARMAKSQGMASNQEWVEQQTGWKFNQLDRKYYPTDTVSPGKGCS